MLRHLSVCRSHWPRGLRRSSASAHLLRLWVRIPPEAWVFVCCECCVLSGRGLCDELITRPEESYRLLWVVVCVLETSWIGRPCPTGCCCAKLTSLWQIVFWVFHYNNTAKVWKLEHLFIWVQISFDYFRLNNLRPSVSPVVREHSLKLVR
jgi:hypothetical protein